MRLFSKIFSIILVLSVLYALFVPSVKARCSFNSYHQCTGTCSCPAGYCGVCSCVAMYGYCTSYSNCHSCPNSTSAPQPTDTPRVYASPTSNPTATLYPTPIQISPTLSPYETRCGTGKCTNGYYCCQNPNGSAACCPVGSPVPGGGNNPTNTPALTSIPTNTPTPTRTPTPTPTNTPTPTPDPHWIKLKNTSFYTSRSLTQTIPALPVAFDADDDGTAYFIIASSGSDPGLVAASYINLGTASVSTKNWKTTEPQNPFTFTPSQFLAYLKTRTALKTITDINNISSINGDTVVFNGNLTVDSTNISLFNSKKLVLLVDGNLNINVNLAPSSSSIALLSTGTITISQTVSQVNAILIGQNVDLGTTTNQGLKIIGNLVAIESLTNNRKWSTSSKPAVFVVFDKNLYLDLLPHLTVVKYSWRETQ